MATIATQQAAITGTTLTFAAAASGDKLAADGRTCLIVKNGAGGSIDVTITVPGTDRLGRALSGLVVAVAAGAEKIIGPLPRDLNGTDKLAAITWSSTTTITRAVVRV